MQFPRLVYKSAEIYTLANDSAEFDVLIKGGWFPSVPEAIAKSVGGEIKEQEIIIDDVDKLPKVGKKKSVVSAPDIQIAAPKIVDPGGDAEIKDER